MKGIILAGGSGSRLYPCTKVTSKQLLPIYNKPMVLYPLNTLLRAGIKEILIIVAPDHAGDFMYLLGSGKEYGAKFTYEIQDKPNGLAEAFIIGDSFIGDDSVTMVLGDNLFEDDFAKDIVSFEKGARVFAKEVEHPHRFGVVEFDEDMRVISMEEKPTAPKSNFASAGLYIFDNTCVAKAKSLKPSARGELEIVDLQKKYLEEGTMDMRKIQGAWFDTGTFDSWLEASMYVKEHNL